MRRVIVLLVISIAVSSAHGATVLKQRITSRGFGPRHFAASVGTTTLWVDDGKGHLITEQELTGKVLKRLTPKTLRFETTRFDKDLVWWADPKAETYSEMSFALMRQRHEEMLAQLEEMRGEAPPPEADAEAPAQGYQFEPPKIEIRETDQTEIIAGLEARLTEVRVITKGTHVETGQVCEVIWELDQWIGAVTEASKQIAEFYAQYVDKLGFSQNRAAMIGDRIGGMLSAYDGMDELFERLSSVEGTPLRHTMRLRIGGECMGGGSTGAEGEQAEAPDPMAGAKKTFAKFKGAFGRKNKKKKEEAETQARAHPVSTTTAGAMKVFFDITVETEKIGEEDTESTIFDEPTHLKKVEPTRMGAF
jgi:hypothetical protein